MEKVIGCNDINIVVIGLGSMGRRRIRLMKQNMKDIFIIGIDEREDRRNEVSQLYGIKVYCSLRDALSEQRILAAFISTSPLSHGALIRECLEYNLHVFTELNLVQDQYEQNMALASLQNKVLFLSSTFLYRKEIEYMIDKVHSVQGIIHYNYHVGQYLPDWHPWEKYSDFFVGNKKTSGCREIFAIEFPWLLECFGEVKSFAVKRSKVTSLSIDYPDGYLVLLEHHSGHKGVLSVDIASRKAVRNLEIYGESIYLKWDGTPNGLYNYNIEQKCEELQKLYDDVNCISGYSQQIVENAYYKEIENFFHVIEGKEEPRYSFYKDKKTLDLIDQLEKG